LDEVHRGPKKKKKEKERRNDGRKGRTTKAAMKRKLVRK
jgi:hypothetical protein